MDRDCDRGDGGRRGRVLRAAVVVGRRKRTERLKQRFGPEYQRSVAVAGERKAAGREFTGRERMRDELDIVALPPTAGGNPMTAHDRHADAPRTWNVSTFTEEQEPTTATSEHPDEYTPAADPLTVQHPFHESTDRGGEGSESEPTTARDTGLADAAPSPPPTTATSEHPDEYTPAADPLTVQHPFHESTDRGGQGSGSEPDPSTTGSESGTAVTDQQPAGRADNSRVEPSAEPSLFADDDLAELRARWNEVQAGFVDDPRACVQKADGLVSDVVTRLTSGFTEARSRLEHQWGRGEEASTEDLRVALTRYREFFERLLAV
ncbi:MAG: hypothetical protein QOE04_1794 [Mycobacterium sp.]|nr:hypothetical protein [Mycobacterium sp.]